MVVDLLLIGLAVTLFPLPVMAFVLVLASPSGVRKGVAFILAWLACLVAVIGIVVLLTGGQPPAPRSAPSRAAQVATVVIGVGLVGYAWYRRRRLHRGAADRAASEKAPRKASSSDGISLRYAAVLPLLLQPWGMVSAAAVTVVHADLSDAGNVVALVVFCLVATSTLLVMELWMVFSPERAHATLTGLHDWLTRHKEPAVFALCLLLGLWLVSHGLYELSA